MLLSIQDGALYCDGLFLSYCGVSDERQALRYGRYAVETRYSHAHGEDLPYVDGIGWVGPSSTRGDVACELALGRVRNRADVIPCPTFVVRLLALLEAADERGQIPVTLVIE